MKKTIDEYRELVKNDPQYLNKISKKVLNKHPEIYREAVNSKYFDINKISEKILMKYPEICLQYIKGKNVFLSEIPEKVLLKHPEICLEAVRINGYALRSVPKKMLDKYPNKYLEICLEAAKQNGFVIENLPLEMVLKYPREYLNICMEAVKQNGMAVQHVDLSMFIKYPKEYLAICMEAVKENGLVLNNLPPVLEEEYPAEYLEICMEAVKQNRFVFEDLSKKIQIEKPEICVEVLKKDIDLYLADKFYGSELEEVKKWMFEDVKRIERIKLNSEIYLSSNYNEKEMDIYYHKMIKTIGFNELEKLLEIPILKKEDIEKYNLQYSEQINRLFEIRYKLEGEIEAVVDIFKILELDRYEKKGKNIKFEIYKSINRMLEEGQIESMEEIIVKALKESEIELTDNDLIRLRDNKNIIVGKLANQRIYNTKVKLKNSIESLLEDQVTIISKEVIERIIADKVIEVIKEEEGKCDVEKVKNKIREELSRENDQGEPFYSLTIRNQEKNMLNIVEKYIGEERDLSKTLVKVVNEQKERIGKGWIRKIIDLPEELSKEEYEVLINRLGFIPDATYEARIRDKSKEVEAYKMLSEIGVGVVTYDQIKIMFEGVKTPYSEKFKEFFIKYRDEILSDPKIYLNLSKMHNKFDEILNDRDVVKGEISPKTLLRILSKKPYDNIREGNEEVAKVAAKAGLNQKYFEIIQDIYEKTKLREGSTIPPVKIEGNKYRVRTLRADDILNLFVGNITKCCQILGGEAEGSMIHGATEKNGGIFVVEKIKEKGKAAEIVAQSWTWRNGDILCFDNIEIDSDHKKQMSIEEQKEIIDLYIKAAENAIKTDDKVLKKLLEDGRISQEVYDSLVLKQVVCGLGHNDAIDLTKRVKSGELNKAKEIILPKEEEKIYEGSRKVSLYTQDSRQGQVVLAKINDKKREEIEKRLRKTQQSTEVEMPVIYRNSREVKEYGESITPNVIDKIKKIEDKAYRDEQKILQGCESIENLASRYNLNPEKIEIKISSNEDWYMIGEEREGEYYIADIAMLGGLHSQNKGEVGIDSKIATMEIAREMYKMMIEMAEKGKKIRYEATRDTSYINTKRMEEKGLIVIESNEEDRFGNSEIEMNNVTILPKKEKLKEELEKVDKLLDKLEERELFKTIESKAEEIGK